VKVNHKRLRRLLSEWDLALKTQVARPRGGEEDSQGSKRQPQPDPGLRALAVAVSVHGFTEIRYAGGTKKAYLMVLIGPTSGCWVAGWTVGKSANQESALKCSEMANHNLAARGSEVLQHDRASRPRSLVH